MEDISSALDYISEHSDEWRISKKFVLAGYSAGATNAVLYTHAFDSENRVITCIAFSGAYDMNKESTRTALQDDFGGVDIISLFSGVTDPKADGAVALYEAASPCNNIKNVPTLIFHDSNDKYMDVETTVKPYIELLANEDVDYKFIIVPNTQHTVKYFDPSNSHYNDVMTEMDSWLSQYLNVN